MSWTLMLSFMFPFSFTKPYPCTQRNMLPLEIWIWIKALWTILLMAKTGKRKSLSWNATSDYGLKTRYLFVTDQNIKISFLIGTGADRCVYSRKFIRGQRCKSDYELSATNGIIIKTYSTELLTINFGLRRHFNRCTKKCWAFPL